MPEPDRGDGLHKCAVCRQYTKLGPLLILRRWKFSLPICLDCTQRDDLENVSFTPAAHREPWRSLVAFFVTGRWVWDLPGMSG